MVDRIVDLDDISLALNGVGHVDGCGFDAKQRFGQRGLAVARLPIKQERFVRVHGRPDLREDVGFYHKMLEGLAQQLRAQPILLEPLAPHHLRVLIERDGRGTGVLVVVQAFAREVPSGLGEREDARHIAHAERFLYAHHVLPLHRLEHFVDEAELQPEQAPDVAPDHLAAEVKKLEDEVLDNRRGNARFFDRLRDWRNDF